LSGLGHPVAGHWVFYLGLSIGGLLVFGALVRWAADGVARFSSPALNHILGTIRFALNAVSWFGGLVFGPFIRQALNARGVADASLLTWTASKKRGRQGCDFFPIRREGYRIAGARFHVRPDRSLTGWHAGFRLTPKSEKLEEGEIKSTVLAEFSATFYGPQQEGFASAKEGAAYGPWAMTGFQTPPPSRVIDISVSAHARGSLWLTYRFDEQAPMSFEFREEYAEQLVLVA
jgi:hypothetical protein